MMKFVFWHWWVIAVVLVIVEAFVAGTFFLWMGVSAAVVGFVLLIAPGMGWEYQVLLFAVFSVVSIALWLIRLKKYPTRSQVSNLNRRAARYLGHIAIIKDPVVNGLGTINVDDTIWRVMGPDCEAGTKVKVIGAAGTNLKVEIFMEKNL
ncbi:MAG: NfeD family protein [bacterium]|nr:NfeD family protein [bacterium]MDT8366339.1 NfeD family protein [bacterium]